MHGWSRDANLEMAYMGTHSTQSGNWSWENIATQRDAERERVAQEIRSGY